jgi:hypothetical protein
MAPPTPLAPVGAPGETTAVSAGAPTAAPTAAAEQFFTPAVLRPAPTVPPASARSFRPTLGYDESPPAGTDARKWTVLAGGVLFVIAAVATAWFTFGGGAGKHQAPVVLPPKAPTAGLPTSLDAIVRIEAESSRRNALQAVEAIGSGDPARLAAQQPNYSYVAGDQASQDPHTVSVGQNISTVTVAVSGSNKDICAYGRWSPNATPMYVTMAHEPSCTATTAPDVGWSSEPGGAASDLPDDPG